MFLFLELPEIGTDSPSSSPPESDENIKVFPSVGFDKNTIPAYLIPDLPKSRTVVEAVTAVVRVTNKVRREPG